MNNLLNGINNVLGSTSKIGKILVVAKTKLSEIFFFPSTVKEEQMHSTSSFSYCSLVALCVFSTFQHAMQSPEHLYRCDRSMEGEAIRWVKVNKIDTQVKIQQDILNEAKYSGLGFIVNIKGPIRKPGGGLGW